MVRLRFLMGLIKLILFQNWHLHTFCEPSWMLIYDLKMSNRVIFNLNGTKFEVGKESFKRLQGTYRAVFPLVDDSKANTPEYFFERNADCFGAVLDFLQSGQLHLPAVTCPELFQRELRVWGISPKALSPCCNRRYLTFFAEESILLRFKRTIEGCSSDDDIGIKSPRFGFKIWRILEEPSSSKWAKIYFTISSMIVLLSVFALAAGTHQDFRRMLSVDEWRQVLGDERFRQLKPWLPINSNATAIDLTLNAGMMQDVGSFPVGLQDNKSQILELQDDMSQRNLRNRFRLERPDIPFLRATQNYLVYIEYATTIYFSIELLVRFCFAPNKRRFFSSFLNLTDAVALLATLARFLVLSMYPVQRYKTSVIDYVDCLQIIRVFRVFRVVKNVIGFRVLLYSVRYSFREILLLMLYLSVGSVLFASTIFFMEKENMGSIPDAAWYAVVTMTTVGYGDMTPITFQGKLVGCMCAICGVFLIAVTVPIFVNNFVLFYSYSHVAADMNSVNREVGEPKHNPIKVSRSGSAGKNKIGIGHQVVVKEN